MEQREHWSSQIGFVLAAAGSAVGLGNLWKFPYIAFDNQGGAFVLVYLVCILMVGLPIMMAEILIGRKTQKSPVGAMRAAVGPVWGWVGGLGVFTGFVLLGYYNVVAGWTIRSFVQCLGWSFNGYPAGQDMGADFGGLLQAGGMQVGLAALFMIATMGVVVSGVGKGIERAARILLPLLFVILLLLLSNALRMEGAGHALRFIFRPNFGDLTWDGVLEALGHSFFTLSLGMGAMITYGSYLSRRDSVVRASSLVVGLDTIVAIVATITMFAVIFSRPGLEESVSGSTAGMLFITLPDLFYTLVPAGRLLAPLFFLLVGFAALTSTVSLLEVAVSYFIDERGMQRRTATLMCGGVIYVLSILCALSFGSVSGLSGFTLPGFAGKQGLFANLDHLVANYLLPVGGLLVTLAAGWIMTTASTRDELEDQEIRYFSFGLWHVFIRFVAPIAVATILGFVIFAGADFS